VASIKSKAKKSAKAKAKSKSRKPVRKARAVNKPAKKDWRVACKNLDQIRRNIDRLDAVIVPLLCQRLHFVTQAANFKPSVAGVVVPSRVEEIVGKVRAIAAQMDTNPDTIERVYRDLINAFTADEQRHWQELHKA
jgi:isochorismate pyruvate lyase